MSRKSVICRLSALELAQPESMFLVLIKRRTGSGFLPEMIQVSL